MSLFLRIYLGIALVLIAGTLLVGYLYRQGVERAFRASMEDRLIEEARIIRENLDPEAADSAQRASARLLGRAYGLAADLLSRAGLDLQVRSELDSEGSVVQWVDDRPTAFVPFNEDLVLALEHGRRRVGGFLRLPPGPPPRRKPEWDSNDRPPPGDRPARGPRWRPDGPPRLRPDGGPGRREEVTTLFYLAVIGIPILLIAPAIYLMIRPLENRIGDLADTAARFGEGDLDVRADDTRTDALSGLASTFNRMGDQIRGSVEGQKELLRAVSHELRTPLARLFFIVDDAEAARTVEEKDAQLARIQATLTEMNDLVEELLTFIRLEGSEAESETAETAAAPILYEMREIAADLRDDVAVSVTSEPDLQVAVDGRTFRRAILNLLTNAVRHADSAVSLTARPQDDGIVIDVEDDGPGVPADMRDGVFRPFVRVDESRTSHIGGIGLGLTIVQRIVTRCGGSISIGDSELGGARFTLWFPSPDLTPKTARS